MKMKIEYCNILETPIINTIEFPIYKGPLWADTRSVFHKQIKDEYGFCVYCFYSQFKLTIDHVDATKNKNKNNCFLHEKNNLAPACSYCNKNKSNTSLIVFLAQFNFKRLIEKRGKNKPIIFR